MQFVDGNNDCSDCGELMTIERKEGWKEGRKEETMMVSVAL